MTEYIVLARYPEVGERDEGWLEVAGGRVHARSQRSALAAFFEIAKREDEHVNFSGEWVAVPARSWRPVSVTVQTETKVKIG